MLSLLLINYRRLQEHRELKYWTPIETTVLGFTDVLSNTVAAEDRVVPINREEWCGKFRNIAIVRKFGSDLRAGMIFTRRMTTALAQEVIEPYPL